MKVVGFFIHSIFRNSGVEIMNTFDNIVPISLWHLVTETVQSSDLKNKIKNMKFLFVLFFPLSCNSDYGDFLN